MENFANASSSLLRSMTSTTFRSPLPKLSGTSRSPISWKSTPTHMASQTQRVLPRQPRHGRVIRGFQATRELPSLPRAIVCRRLLQGALGLRQRTIRPQCRLQPLRFQQWRRRRRRHQACRQKQESLLYLTAGCPGEDLQGSWEPIYYLALCR